MDFVKFCAHPECEIEKPNKPRRKPVCRPNLPKKRFRFSRLTPRIEFMADSLACNRRVASIDAPLCGSHPQVCWAAHNCEKGETERKALGQSETRSPRMNPHTMAQASGFDYRIFQAGPCLSDAFRVGLSADSAMKG